MNNDTKRKKILLTGLTLLLSLLLIFFSGEMLTRLFWKQNEKWMEDDERNLTYNFDKELGWFPKKNNSKDFMGSRLIHVQHNENGFRDILHGRKEKKRIAFIGDSFVWGYDVQQEERFTEKLQPMIPDYEIINMGVSGYGTDQELLLLQKWFDVFQPEIVFLVYDNTDWGDNNSNYRYGCFKPFFEIDNGKLIQKGIPVIKSMKYYYLEYPMIFQSRLLRLLLTTVIEKKKREVKENPTVLIMEEIKVFSKKNGAEFAIGFVGDNNYEQKKSICEKNNFNYLFLKNPYIYPTHGFHWTPQGHDIVASKIYQFLLNKNWIQKK